MKNIFNNLIFLLNSFTLSLLIIAYISPYINPNIFWPISFVGLFFPILYLINILFLLYWALNKKKQFFANIIILLIGSQHIQNYIGVNPKKTNNETIKILTYNVRMFNTYDWISNLKKDEIVNYIKQENADILCIQEFYENNNKTNLNYKFNNIKYRNNENPLSLAIYSKFPQINTSNIIIDNNNICIYSDIKIKQDTIRVYNMHLASNWFKQSDYSFINNPKKETIKNGVTGIIQRMKISYAKRANEVNIIKKHMRKSPYKIIVCGDFNDTPVSYSYRTIKKNLKDSFYECGNGIGTSFVKIPALRIDYIMHDPSLKSFNYKKKEIVLSDHYPISCEIEL